MFTAARPLRYLSFIVSRVDSRGPMDGRLRRDRALDAGDGGSAGRRRGAVQETRPDRRSEPAAGAARGERLADRAADIVQFYESLIGDSPYSSFTVALVESDAARRSQPRVLRAAQPAAAELAAHVAQRSGVVQQLPRVLPGARSRAPVVGTGGRLAQLPRAVAQRGVRAVLRRALRAAIPRRRRVRRRHAADAPVGHRTSRIRGRSISAIASDTSKSEGRAFRA